MFHPMGIMANQCKFMNQSTNGNLGHLWFIQAASEHPDPRASWAQHLHAGASRPPWRSPWTSMDPWEFPWSLEPKWLDDHILKTSLNSNLYGIIWINMV